MWTRVICPTPITNTNISSSSGHNIAVFNNGGTLTELSLSKTTLTGLGTTPPVGQGASGFTIETRNSATASVVATGSTFASNYSVGAQGGAVGSSNLTLKVLGGTSGATPSPTTTKASSAPTQPVPMRTARSPTTRSPDNP